MLTAPRLELDLVKIEHNARALVGRLAHRGIAVTGVTKASLGSPAVAGAFQRGGVTGLGDSRVRNLERLRCAGSRLPRTLIRSPMPSEVDAAVRDAAVSLNTEPAVLAALGGAAQRRGSPHGVILMVELGDLREGAAPGAIVGLAEQVERHRFLTLVGIGTNLACQNGVAPDDANMEQLSHLVDAVEANLRRPLTVVSGGNSANLPWALATADVGRINDLRLGESILLGTEPLHRTLLPGLHGDACVLVAEVIELQTKSVQPRGTIGQSAHGLPEPRVGSGTRRQALLAIGRQDVDHHGVTPPPGCTVVGAGSDHLVLDVAEQAVAVGDRLSFGVNYSALVRAMTSPFVVKDCLEDPAVGGRRVTETTSR